MTDCKYDSGSFRDREGRVFRVGDQVFRGLSDTAKTEWEDLSQTDFYRELVGDGKLVSTELLDPSRLNEAMPFAKDWAAVVSHETIPFISYPYEWTFSMLKDAALLHLDILTAALEEDMICKDSSSYNVQWRGVAPVFIDIASFQKLEQGESWTGYLQFCELFLYPLILQAHRKIPFQPWLRGSIDGIKVNDIDSMFGWTHFTRPGVLAHVKLQAMFQRRFGNTKRNVKEDVKKSGFSKKLIKDNLNSLTRIVNKLEPRKSDSVWVNYQNENTYTDEETREKKEFVESIAAIRRWGLVWDIGSNTGTYSRIAASHAHYVIAMDADCDTVDRLYRVLSTEKYTNITPLVMDIKDPSPNRGWRGRERKSISDRGNPELVLCLAVLHHIVIGANIPMSEFISWLAELGASVVIEFINKEDSMVQQLLRNKDDNYDDYEQKYFEKCLGDHFQVVKRKELQNGTRTLYFVQAGA